MLFNENKYIVDSPNNQYYFNENKYILNEDSFSDAWESVKKYFRFLYQEFLRYIDRVIDVWVRIQAKIKSWLFDAEAAKDKLRKKNIEISISEEQYIYINRGIFFASNSTSLKDLADDWYDALDKAYDDELDFDSIKLKYKNNKFSISEIIDDKDEIKINFNDRVVKDKELGMFINFCKEGRIDAIKTLQYFRNKLAKGINKFIKAKDVDNAKSKEIAKLSAKLRRFINKYISSINKATNAVINAVNKAKSSSDAKDLISGEKITVEKSDNNKTEDIINKTTNDTEKANSFIISQATTQERKLGYNEWNLNNVTPPKTQIITTNDYDTEFLNKPIPTTKNSYIFTNKKSDFSASDYDFRHPNNDNVVDKNRLLGYPFNFD